MESLADGPAAYVSVFAGRIADSGRDPLPAMTSALDILRRYGHLELIWASPREVLNVVQAAAIGCHIITVTHDLLKKLAASRPRPRPVLARDGGDVLQGRAGGRAVALIGRLTPQPSGVNTLTSASE